MIRAYLVDDERLAVERLTRLLQATGRVTIAGSHTDPEAALAALRELEAQLDARRFARIHRATIVNIGFVEELFPAVDAACWCG